MMEWWSSDQPVYSYMCWERVYNCDKCIFVRTSLSCRWCNNVCRSVYSTTLPYWCTLRIWWVSVCDLSMSIIDWQQSASHIVTVARSSLLLIFTLEQVLLYTTSRVLSLFSLLLCRYKVAVISSFQCRGKRGVDRPLWGVTAENFWKLHTKYCILGNFAPMTTCVNLQWNWLIRCRLRALDW